MQKSHYQGEININNLKSGFYFMKIKNTRSGFQESYKFVKY